MGIDTGPPVSRLRRLLPFATLAWSVFSALWMNRSPERAWLVAFAVALGWLAMAVAVLLIRRAERAQAEADPTGVDGGVVEPVSRAARLARFTATAATQTSIQITLFFVLPFFWFSSAPVLGHRVFLGFLGFAAALTLWDPIFCWLMRRTLLALMLKAIASFVGLFAALPFMGLSHWASLWLAAAVTAIGVPIVATATSRPAVRSLALRAGLIVGAAAPVAVWLGAAEWIPAAPLRLTESGLGTGIDREARKLLGRATAFPKGTVERLHCFTAIYAPLGLHEEVFHVWTRDGAPLFRASLGVGGNRKGAWRTWSNVQGRAPGLYRCEVLTSTGQLLGRVEARVE